MLIHRTRGLTLIELLIGLAITATVVCFSLPLFSGMQAQHQQDQLAHDLMGMLTFSRSQAFLRDETLVLAPDEKTHDWSSGAHLFVPVKEGTHPPEIQEDLHTWQWSHTHTHVSWHGFQSKAYIRIDSDLGRLAMNGYFLIENVHTSSKKVVVNRFGRVHIV